MNKRLRISPRSVIGVLLGIAAVAAVFQVAPPPPGGTRGDVNFDSSVSVLDALATLQSTVGKVLPDSIVIDPNGDVDCSETITSLDALIILSDIVGLDVSTTCIGRELVAQVIVQPVDTLFVGDTTHYTVTLLSAAGDTLADTLPGRKVRWTTSDALLATVDTTTGRVSAVGAGLPTLTATSERVSGTPIPVKIHPSVDSVRTNTTTVSFNVFGAQQTITATAYQAGGTQIPGVNPRWASSDTLVAKVSEAGVVTAVGNGSATISASAGGVISPPVSINVLQTISGICSITDPLQNGTTHTGGTITADTTWTKATSPHMVTSDLDVSGGAVLTIEPGVIVCLGYFVDLDFINGARLVARGSPTDSIVFAAIDAANQWGRLGFYGAPADTSYVTNAVMEDGGRATGLVEVGNTHPVVVDSSMIVRSMSRAVYSNAPGVRISRTTIDGTLYEGVYLDNTGLLEESTVLNSGTGYDGVWIRASNTIVRDFLISNSGRHGLHVDCCYTGVQVLRGRIEASAQEGLYVTATLAALSDVRVTGSGSYGFRGPIQNLAMLAPDSAAQDSLKGNTRDTLVVTGGTITGVEQVVRPDLPWRVEGGFSVHGAGGLLRVLPGASLAMGTGARIYFDNGADLWARGTPSDSVRFTSISPTDYWPGLQFNSPPEPDPFSLPPPDTSYITNAVVERGGLNGWRVIQSEEKHVVLIDSARVSDMHYYGPYLNSSGSRISRSVVGPNTAGEGIYLAGGTVLDSVTVRAIAEDAIDVNGHNVVVEDFQIDSAGRHGLEVRCCSWSGIRVERGRILASGGEGLRALSPLTALSQVDVSGSGSYGFRGLAQNLNKLAPDSLSQDLLLGNLANAPGSVDTLVITGGAISGAEQFVRRDLPWRVEGSFSVLSPGGLLRIEPGTRMAMGTGARVTVDDGGELWARGTPSDTIYFSPIVPTDFWPGFEFHSPPEPDPLNLPQPDTSYITNVVLERPGRCCWTSIVSDQKHVVLIDSVLIRQFDYNGVYLNSPGSRISRSMVGPNATASGDGIELRTGTTLDSVTVRGIKQDGVIINGHNVVVEDFQIDTAGRYGLDVRCCSLSGGRVERGEIVGTGSEGLRVLSPLAVLSQVDVSGSGSYGFRGLAQNLNHLAPDSASQVALLLGNARDTVVLSGGAITADTQVVIPNLPWRVENTVQTLGAGGLLRVRPGATLAFNTNGQLYFDTGGRLEARGTAADTIRFVSVNPPDFWETLRFLGSPGDTSFITNAIVERAGRSGWRPIHSESTTHPVAVDSTIVRQSHYYGVRLNGAGSRISRSTVTTNVFAEGVELGNNTLLENTVVNRAAGSGVWVYGNNVTIRDFVIDSAGSHGLDMQASRSGSSVERGTITASGSEGLRVLSPLAALSQVQVTNSGSYGFRGLAQNLNLLAPDSISHDNLLGNARDTLVLTGGAISTTTHIVRRDLPWRVEATVQVLGAGGRLLVRPGATVAFNTNGQLWFDTGGRLEARGTPTDTVFFKSVDTNYWETLRFSGTPSDTSWITNAVVERGGRGGWRPVFGEHTTHPVVLDSAKVRLSQYYGVYLRGAGSRLSRTVITANVFNSAVELGGTTLMEESVVQNAADDGVYIFEDSVVVRSSEITGSVGDGVHSEQQLGIHINNSNLFGNGGLGVNNNATNVTWVIDAASNWWGDAAGPAGTNGDGVDTNVNIDPVLTAPVVIPPPAG